MNIPLQHGKYSGSALWVRSLIGRIIKMKDWINKLYFVDEELKRPAEEKYKTIYDSFKQFIVHHKFNEWKEEIKDLELAS